MRNSVDCRRHEIAIYLLTQSVRRDTAVSTYRVILQRLSESRQHDTLTQGLLLQPPRMLSHN